MNNQVFHEVNIADDFASNIDCGKICSFDYYNDIFNILYDINYAIILKLLLLGYIRDELRNMVIRTSWLMITCKALHLKDDIDCDFARKEESQTSTIM